MNDRFKFRIIIEKNYKTINGMCKGQIIHYCNGFIQTKLKTYFFGENKRLSFLNSQIKAINQSTGLKDKNGKLIYEGDIVKIKNEIFFIKYEIGSFFIIRNQQAIDAWYEMFTEAWNDDVYPLSQLYVDEYIQEEYIDCIEVIGNIYKNPELLEESK